MGRSGFKAMTVGHVRDFVVDHFAVGQSFRELVGQIEVFDPFQ